MFRWKTAALVATAIAIAVPAMAQVTDAEAEVAIMAYVNATQAGDRDGLLAVLAPEFQIQRPNGEGAAREEYVAGAFVTITEVLGSRTSS